MLVAVLVRVDWGPLTDFDVRVATDLHSIALDHPGQVTVWRDVSDVLSPTNLRIAAVILAVVLLVGRRALEDALLLLVAVLGSWALSVLSKVIVDRDRPHFASPIDHAAGQSYPSGHALTSFVALVVVTVICPARFRRAVAAGCVVLIAAVGFSRMFLGVHYLTDVVGAWLLGAAWVGVVVLILRRSTLAARVRA